MKHPVGIFDSGLGGLCALRELRALLPEEDLIYFGDVARLPYGTRSAQTICRYAAQDAAFLLSKQVKAILVACGTVSALALDTLQKQSPVPLVGMVEPAARAALAATKNRRVAVLGTQATIAGGAYERVLRFFASAPVFVESIACPLLVPLAENGQTSGELARLAVREYLARALDADCDTILLGCTHYPLFLPLFSELAPDRTFIDTGKTGAAACAALLRERGLLGGGSGAMQLYTSDFSQGFETLAKLFLQDENAEFVGEKVAIETWE